MFTLHWVVRIILAAAVVGCIALASRALAEDAPRENDAVKPVERVSTGSRQLHEAFLERGKKGNIDVLFLGDGLTQSWVDKGAKVWVSRFEKWNAANFGVEEDRTQHLLWRIGAGKELTNINPKVIILLIGDSNIERNSPEEIAAGIKAVITAIQKEKPKAKILLLGLLPRIGKEEKDLLSPTVMAKDELHPKTKAVNDRIAKLGDGKSVKYLDIGDQFLDATGGVPKSTMYDFHHLTEQGYSIWADAITKPVEEMLK